MSTEFASGRAAPGPAASADTAATAESGLLRRLLDRAFGLAGLLAANCILMIFVLMLVGALGRAMGWKVGAVNDISAWLCAGAAFFAMAHAFKHGDFVQVTLLLERLPPPARRVCDALALALATLAVGYLAWQATLFTWHSREAGDVSGGLISVPMWIPQCALVAGAWLLLLAVLDELLAVLAGRKPSFRLAIEARHAAGDFSSDV